MIVRVFLRFSLVAHDLPMGMCEDLYMHYFREVFGYRVKPLNLVPKNNSFGEHLLEERI